MTAGRLLIWFAWIAATAVVVGSVAAWSSAVPDVPIEAQHLPAAGERFAPDTAGFATHAASLRDLNPFRIDRQPTNVRFDPWQPVEVQASAPEPPAPPRPALVLAGILGGPPWNALVEGVPDRASGALLRIGEQISGIRFDGLRGDTAMFSGFDTTWALTPRHMR